MGMTLEAVPGRKHLVLFSAGFPDETIAGAPTDHRSAQAEARASGSVMGYIERGDPEYLSGSSEIRRGIDKVTARLRGADVVVHAIDARGLRFDPGNGRQSLVALASGTGGDAHWGMNDVEVALEQIDRDTQRFYVLAYRRNAADPPAVELEVSVVGHEAKVTSPTRTLRPPPATEDMTEQQKWLLMSGKRHQ